MFVSSKKSIIAIGDYCEHSFEINKITESSKHKWRTMHQQRKIPFEMRSSRWCSYWPFFIYYIYLKN